MTPRKTSTKQPAEVADSAALRHRASYDELVQAATLADEKANADEAAKLRAERMQVRQEHGQQDLPSLEQWLSYQSALDAIAEASRLNTGPDSERLSAFTAAIHALAADYLAHVAARHDQWRALTQDARTTARAIGRTHGQGWHAPANQVVADILTTIATERFSR